jgi:peptidylprolyl isomerase
MPSSKEVRARQNRQKERIAAQRADRQRINARRKLIATVVGLVLFAGAVAAVLAVMLHNNPDNAAATPPPTTAALQKCVGLKDALPKGAPKFSVPTGAKPTTLTKQDIKIGTGAVIPANAKVKINYVGVACSTGKIFDSSYSRHQPFDADLSAAGSLIKGWQQGIPGMKIGGVRVIGIPSDLAYGSRGNSGIAPDEALYFLVAPVKLG